MKFNTELPLSFRIIKRARAVGLRVVLLFGFSLLGGGSVALVQTQVCVGQSCSSYIFHVTCYDLTTANCFSDYSDCHTCWADPYCLWPHGGVLNTGCSCYNPTSHELTIISNTITCGAGPNNGWCRTSATLNVTVTDNQDHAVNITGTTSAGGSFSGTSPLSFSLPEGQGTASWTAACSSDPNLTTNGSQPWGLDNTPPVITSGVLSDTGWTSAASVSYTCAATDALSGLASVTSPSSSSEGPLRTLTCVATDVAGNTAQLTSASFGIDRTQPILTISVPPPTGNAPWYRGPVMATCNASDALSGLASASPNPTTTQEGTSTLICTANDNAGNTNSASTTVQVDSVAPTAALTCNGSACLSTWYTAPVTLAALSSDATSGVATTTILVDGVASTTVTDGVHAVTVEVCDVAGNCTALASTTVHVDSVAPDAGWRCNGDVCSSDWYGEAVSMTIGASDATSGVSSTSIYIDGTAGSTVGEGAHMVTGRVCDVAGNCTDLPAITVSVDLTPPDIALQAPVILLGGSNLVIATDAMSGLAAITVEITGNGITPRVFVFTNPTGPVVVNWDGLDGNGNEIPYGAYTISATAVDLAGNISTTSGLWVRPLPPTATPIIWTRTPTETPTETPEPRNDTVPPSGVAHTATPTKTPLPPVPVTPSRPVLTGVVFPVFLLMLAIVVVAWFFLMRLSHTMLEPRRPMMARLERAMASYRDQSRINTPGRMED